MKPFFTALFVVVSLSSFGQRNSWFVSFFTSPTIGGPSASLKRQMVDQRFDQISSFSLFSVVVGETKYPVVAKDASLLIRGGKKLSNRRMVYFVTGQTAGGRVEGYRNEGFTDFFLFGSSIGQHVAVEYHLYQFTAGYQYSFAGTRVKLGFGPSAYLLAYSISENYGTKERHTALVPGVNGTARLPLGRERRLVGADIVVDLNLAPDVRLHGQMKETQFRPGRVGMVSVNAGVALSFRR